MRKTMNIQVVVVRVKGSFFRGACSENKKCEFFAIHWDSLMFVFLLLFILIQSVKSQRFLIHECICRTKERFVSSTNPNYTDFLLFCSQSLFNA